MALRGIGAVTKAERQRMLAALAADPFPWMDRNNGMTRLERVVNFLENLTLTMGQFAGQKLFLTTWQRDLVEKIMKCDPKTGRRIIREIVISMGRKNAKSTTGCALAACWLFGPESEPRGQVVAAAVDKDEARNLFDELVAMIEADERLGAFVDIKHHLGQIHVLHGQGVGSTFKTLSADEAKAHGKNLTFVLGDECGLWKGMGLYDGLTTGSGVRQEPLFVFMSTRQRKEDTPLKYLLERAKQKAEGKLDDPSFHAVVYSVPDDVEDIYDESVWPLANPALEGTCEGGFLGWESLRKEANLAKQFPSREQVFRLLHLNQEIGSAASLISRTDWLACGGEIDQDKLRGRPCWVGLDLSSTTDLTAMVLYFPEDGGAVLPFFWMAQEQVPIRTREDGVPYDRFVREGYLETTPGRAIRHRVIARRLKTILGLYDVRAVPYDRSRAEDLMTILHEEGVDIPLVPFGQGWVSMSPAIDAFETAVLNGELRHDGHPILTLCVQNTAAEIIDTYGNRKLVKIATRARIDGTVALVMAIGQWAKRAPDDDTATPFRGMTSGLINRGIPADRRRHRDVTAAA